MREILIAWHTSHGDRTLNGAEASLFHAAVLDLVERIKSCRDLTKFYGIRLFDELTWSQRIAVLDCLNTHLLADPESLPPDLTAVNEAAIASVFAHISYLIDLEIDRGSGTEWRRRVLLAAEFCFSRRHIVAEPGKNKAADRPFGPESEESRSRALWHRLTQTLADQILWDRDFEMMAEFLDEPPEKAAMLRQILGIEENYFSAAADDLNSQEELEATLQRLQQTF